MSTFTVKQKINFKLHTGRTGSGVIDSIQPGERGVFYVVKQTDGSTIKVRAAHLTAA